MKEERWVDWIADGQRDLMGDIEEYGGGGRRCPYRKRVMITSTAIYRRQQRGGEELCNC